MIIEDTSRLFVDNSLWGRTCVCALIPAAFMGRHAGLPLLKQCDENGLFMFSRLFNGLLEVAVRYDYIPLIASTMCMALVFNPRWWMPSISCSRHPLQLVAISEAPVDSRQSTLRFTMLMERS